MRWPWIPPATYSGTSFDAYGDFAYDFATVAYSGSGAALWTNRYNGNAFDNEPAALSVDRNGNVFVVGTSAEGSDPVYAIVAYSGAGVPMWTNLCESLGIGAPTGIAVDPDGNVFAIGLSYCCPYGPSNDDPGTYYRTVAYSNSGVPLWTNLYKGPGDTYCWPSAVAVDSNGHVFVTGRASVYVDGRGFDESYATLAYSSGGAPLWTTRCHAAPFSSMTIPAIAVDIGGNVFITGDSGQGYATVAYSGLERRSGPTSPKGCTAFMESIL